ncbi:TPA: hypothetical protein ACU7AV_006116 [Pseudomonas aeruginosa]|nr:hypothetical protein [Pseudomonas aeruginosa]
MSNELTDVRCPCGAEFQADSYDAGFIAGSGMCQNCDAALPPKDICTCPSGDGSLVHPCPAHPAPVEQAGGDERAAFESRAEDAGSDISRDDFGNYVNVYVQTEWEGWQARAALAQPSPASDLDPLNLAPHAEAFNEAPAEALKSEQAEAELEKQEPVGEVRESGGTLTAVIVRHSYATKLPVGTKLYAAPVAQAQQLHDLDKQCRDDVARALGLRPSQERGFAWSYLLASIKSCVKASEDAAQAQHSVPEGFREKFKQCMELAFAEIAFYVSPEKARNPNSRARKASALATELLDMLAAAPGKEVGHE